MTKPMHLSVVGMGKLGLVMAALYASRGYEVIGVDQNEWLVDEIKQGRCPIQETGLEKLLASCNYRLYHTRLRVTTDYDAVRGTSIVFVIVPTPSNKDGAFSNDYILSAVRSIGLAVKELSHPPLIVITSTVMPGTMEMVIKPELEKILGKKCGQGFKLCYNPEFIALGSVIRDMEKPDAILIGESDEESGNILSEFYHSFHKGNPPLICRMSLWNAEFAKIALNAFLTTKVNLANTYAMICGAIPKGDVDAVTSFLGLDSRIGVKFLKGGVSAGGTCLPRDNRAFAVFAKELGIPTPIQCASIEFSNIIDAHVVKQATELLMGKGKKVVSILGLTYKPNTPIVEESASLAIAKALSKNYRVKVYDPMGMGNAKKELGDSVEYSEDIAHCLFQSDLCIIATPWPVFGELTRQDFLGFMRMPVVLDCWRVLNKAQFAGSGVKYRAIGVNSE